MGEQGWPPLALFKALLLSVWYDLSDVKLAEALEDRASFRRFCGFAADEPTPERTAFVRVRRELVARSLDRVLFETVTNQLDARGVVIRTGTLIDASVIASASLKDEQARWAGHRRRKPVHGDKAHIATDQEGGIIRSVEVTSAHVHDGTVLEAVLPDSPGDVYADSAYAARRFTDVMLAKGGRPKVVQTGTWGGPQALARLEAWNAGVRAVRCRIEKVFGTCKRSYGLRRMRWLGLAKAGLQVRLTAMAYNLRRSATIFRAREA
jgi:IS5 family transposase